MHAIVLAGALLIRAHVPDGPGNPAIIDAALLFDTGEWSSRASVPAADDANGAPPAAPPLPRDDSPPSSQEPAANAKLAEIASAPASEPRTVEGPQHVGLEIPVGVHAELLDGVGDGRDVDLSHAG